ncbi:MAG: DUF4918 family protein [Chitinophagaceae bacterium]|jgi:hypothetical protein|nr:DUF4918 family protein [Chitinophagaceae bacterium]
MRWDKAILDFYRQLKPPTVPTGYEVLYPFGDATVWQCFSAFYERFYADSRLRHMLVGINPGRFGAGVTGVPFTDPIRLKDACGIENPWPRKPELSSIFMYEMMEAFGGLQHFYGTFYITSVSPLGFVQQGKNINYYDDRQLAEAIMPFAVQCMEQQLQWPVNRDVAFCIGEGKNLQYLQQLNAQHGWFKQIEPLAHPRFIMQYKRLEMDAYIAKYLESFSRHGAS